MEEMLQGFVDAGPNTETQLLPKGGTARGCRHEP
jgi:hypothetical protein